MNPAPSLVPEPSRSPDGSDRSVGLYTCSFSDGLGDRLLTFDNSTGMSLEFLRFKKEFGDSPAFEKALRERVELLSHFQHSSVATVRAVERLAGGEGLAVVSKLTPGRRLTDLLSKARGPVFALELVRQLTPALAALQQSGSGIAHGAISAERIVIGREGRLILVDHVLGSAIEALRLPVGRLQSELGLVLQVGPDATHLDPRSDIIQLGFLALSLLLGRRLDPADYPGQVPTLLNEFTNAEPGHASAPLRRWLERALQVGVRPFASAKDAHDALAELPEDGAPTSTQPDNSLRAFRSPEAGADAPADTKPAIAVKKPELKLASPGSAKADVAKGAPVLPAASPVAQPTATSAAPPPARRSGGKAWALGAVGTLAVVEAVVIAGLLYARLETVTLDVRSPRADVAASATVSPAPTEPSETPAPAASAPNAAATAAATQTLAATAAPTTAIPGSVPAERPAAAGARFGGIRFAASIELQVFEGGRLLGSTAGPIAVNEGSHELELVNEALGFRSRQSVAVKAGQLTSVTITLPTGRLSINAVPWAEVVIDGTSAGQTPIANLSLPIGSHEIVFRHPQFPEQRQTVVVKADGLTRVSATLQR